jgi:monoamine oxidase
VNEHIDADVCIVGAGYAGLTAARRLAQAGQRVVVLEARDRVGGRVWTRTLDDGTALDIGGTWVGPRQDAVRRLIAELGIALYPTYSSGKTVFVSADRKVSRYGGLFPPIGPLALISLGQAIFRIDRMAKTVSLDAPWSGGHAADWDNRSPAAWIAGGTPTATAKALMEATVRGLLSTDPADASLLDLLYLVRSAGNLNALLSIEGGYQQDRVMGGAQAMALRMAADLGEAVQLGAAVTSLRQETDAVTITSARFTVRATHCIVTAPPALVREMQFDPPLPQARAGLLQRMYAGTTTKALAVYDEPFWRADGLNGQSVSLDGPIETTLDASPAIGSTSKAGIIAGFAFGPRADAMARLPAEERRELVLGTLALRFGERARSPVLYEEYNWGIDEWTRGCSFAHMERAGWVENGPALRPPVGRIHWAGTETAGTSHGTIDGAVRSGERAAAEVLSRS